MSKPRKTTKNRKPRVDELIAARNPMQRLAVTPVDLYSVAPPETPTASAPSGAGESESHDRTMSTPSTVDAATTAASTKPASPTMETSSEGTEDVVVPYGTYIRSSQRTGIKLRAAVTGRDAYEIVQAAIDEYFENHPLEL